MHPTREYLYTKYGTTAAPRVFLPPSFTRMELAVVLQELGVRSGAEIGVLRGEYSELLASMNPNCTLYSIDPWRSYHSIGRQSKHNANYQHAVSRLQPYPNVQIIRKTSKDAAQDIPDESLDFVYIDGDHSFAAVAHDIQVWSTKVKRGGIVAGHDYVPPDAAVADPTLLQTTRCGHVTYVVDAYAAAYEIPTIFIMDVPSGIGTWMWVKE